MQNANALHEAENKKLMAQRKLVLILDLDKTLIHTTGSPVTCRLRTGIAHEPVPCSR